MLLCLPAPYGKGKGDSISLRSDGPADIRIFDILEGFGCPPFIADKAARCINHSRRYDCEVKPEWFRSRGGHLQEELREVGVRIIVQRWTPRNTTPMDPRFVIESE